MLYVKEYLDKHGNRSFEISNDDKKVVCILHMIDGEIGGSCDYPNDSEEEHDLLLEECTKMVNQILNKG